MNAPTFKNERDRYFFIAAGGLTLIGSILRLAAGRGDLWLDEVWSVWLVSRIHSAGDVFRGINHDNNHFLNSLWIYLVGQKANSFVYRIPAIIFACLSIPVAGWTARRGGWAAVLVVMLLFSINFVLIEYGTQARGYSGLILFTLLAVNAGRGFFVEPNTTRRRKYCWLLGLWCGLGFLSHSLMGESVIALGLTALIVFWRLTKSPWLTVRETARMMLPTLLLIAPTAICLITEAGKFQIGLNQRFHPLGYWAGLGNSFFAIMGVLNVSNFLNLAAGFITPALVIHYFARINRSDPLYLAALIFTPAIFFLLLLPNSGNPRYFLPIDVMFLLAIGEGMGLAFSSGRESKVLAQLAVIALLFMNGSQLSSFYRYGRGDYSGLIAQMASQGTTNDTIKFGAPSFLPMTGIMEYYAGRRGLQWEQVLPEHWCDNTPDWLFLEPMSGPIPVQVARIERDCNVTLEDVPMPTFCLSWPNWAIYHVHAKQAP